MSQRRTGARAQRSSASPGALCLLVGCAQLFACTCAVSTPPPQDKANLDRQLKQLNSKSTLLEKTLEKKDTQVNAYRGFGFQV
jgi:hypothetical protein